MIVYDELINDPRPELQQDTNLWVRLLRSTVTVEGFDKSGRLLTGLWQIRALGAQIRPSKDGVKIIPILQPDGAWDSEAEFKELVGRHLGDCAVELNRLLKQIVTAR